MLHQLVELHREDILRAASETIRQRTNDATTSAALEAGLRRLLSTVESKLARHEGRPRGADVLGEETSATEASLVDDVTSPAHLVYNIGALCNAITEVAERFDANIPAGDFRALNSALDDAIASAISAYTDHRSERSNALERERLGFLAHELRNALGAAQLAFVAMRDGKVGVAPATGRVLGRSLERLRFIVEHALADVRASFPRASIPIPRSNAPVGSTELLLDVDTLMRPEAIARGVELDVHVQQDASCASVAGDREALVSATTNLTQNAIKFTPPNGHVWVRAFTVHDADRPAELCIEIEDECGGLDDGVAEEIFRPFVQRAGDRSGLGLGLAITERTVSAHGGRMKVRNLPGRGCVFSITLPCRESARDH